MRRCISTYHHRAERPHEKSHAERGQRQQQRYPLVGSGEEQLAYRDGEKAVGDEIEPLQGVADRCRGDRAHSSVIG